MKTLIFITNIIIINFFHGDCLDIINSTYSFPTNILKAYNFQQEIKSHPMLLFDNSFLSMYMEQAETTHRHIAQRIAKAVDIVSKCDQESVFLPPESQKMFAAVWNEKYGNVLPLLAMHFYLNQNDRKLLNFIVLFMDRMASYDSWYVNGLQEVRNVLVCFTVS